MLQVDHNETQLNESERDFFEADAEDLTSNLPSQRFSIRFSISEASPKNGIWRCEHVVQ
jgi:hypothetical protein